MVSNSSQRNFRSLLSTFRSPDHKPTRNPETDTELEGSQTRKTYQKDLFLPNYAELQDQSQIPNAGIDIVDDDIPLDAFDKELLSQLGYDAAELAVPMYEPKDIPHTEPFSTPLHRGHSSKFSSSNTIITPPFQRLASSSSGFESPLSPSLTTKEIYQGKLHREGLDVHKSPHWPSAREATPPVKFSPFQRPPIVKSPEIQLKHAQPLIQGIRLVSTRELPDRFRALFSFHLFNAIQSKSFPVVYHRTDNVVLSAPTGSGKTVIMELAICKLVSDLKDSRFKVIYLAPTKSLCSERSRDWRAKFTPLDLQCAELTGDTDHFQIRNVQQASIIVTTPEKWDSMTRKWKDHMKLMQLIKLVLIDEVHILKEARGATLEAVVSRMKSVNSNVRFVALSATVPNSEDIATWLGKDPTNQHLPAHRERFGEDFRPVRLQKFVYGYQANGNDFAFDKVCETKLPEILTKHSSKKPILVFCCTRNSAITTSKNLAKLWSSTNPPQRLWKSPTKPIHVQNADLNGIVPTGVAFHHAGLDSSDRHNIETGFLTGQINVICCTSTLAVGVNLHATWWSLKIQCHGKMVVARNHLNAEIGLGTVTDVESAIRWLRGTFFFVRLQRNPTCYKLKEGGNRADEDELLRSICEKDLELLRENGLVTTEPPFKSTELGDAMARYYVKFETMKLFLSLPPKAKISEILSVIAQADEFRDIRLKPGEKSLYKEINKANGIKFPIKTDINLSAHKITLLIQSELGAVELPSGDQFQKHRLSFQQDKSLVFSHINRIIRCIIDCQLAHGDSVSARHALELSRSLGAKAWDDSVLQLKQIDQIGIVAVRKFASAGITNMEQLEAAEPIRIETLLSRNPPFGMKLLARVAEFPKPRVSLKEVGKDVKPGKTPRLKFRADVGFVNEKVPLYFQKRQVYLCFLAEVSDGRIVDFRRFHASKLQKGQQIVLTAEIKNPFQTITCTVMCDEIAGTMRQAELQPALPKFLFSACKGATERKLGTGNCPPPKAPMKTGAAPPTHPQRKDVDDFSDDPLNYSDFIPEDFDDIFQSKHKSPATAAPAPPSITSKMKKTISRGNSSVTSEPVQLDNGKWACNHRCKDKTAEGTDHPPKQSKKQVLEASNQDPQSGNCEPKPKIPKVNTKLERQVDIIDLTKPEPTYGKKLYNRAIEGKSTSKCRGRDKTPTSHSLYSRRTSSPLSDDTLDPLQLPLPSTKAKVAKHTSSSGEDFEEFESLMGDFESSSSENDMPVEKEMSQRSGYFPSANADFDNPGDLFVENDIMDADYFSQINDKHSGVLSPMKRSDVSYPGTSQGEGYEGISIPTVQSPKERSPLLPARPLQCNVDLLSTSKNVGNGHSSVTNPPSPEKSMSDMTMSGKENLNIFKLVPSKRRISDSAAIEIPSVEDTGLNIPYQSDSPQPEPPKYIDPLLLEEFGAVAEFY
ncbi:ATP-dependent DNA helicase MER3 [Nannizzia gypsea CBS 118893]|uniref:DNA 3'-5' helicase n=1 Tax=Arthroderma gypseum (strain ATCC MYA-4604 / CBS 118893) TaxID=535722 RepID=E5QZT6_ARTGP|nr:ATP-dependent DNA helicase MER3 [Nannizzia gypsea CBS 118893]EFQ97399.1 ATP-dependent DNA helicase MER3 [Nannizzia gypsea CBS 118893]